MIRKLSRNENRLKRHHRLRNFISGTSEMPRLAVFRSNKHIYAQIIDDTKGHTLVAASSLDKELKLKNTADVAAAKAVGDLVAKKATKAGISCVVFDRGGYIYHGKVAALADAAREAGLQF